MKVMNAVVGCLGVSWEARANEKARMRHERTAREGEGKGRLTRLTRDT